MMSRWTFFSTTKCYKEQMRIHLWSLQWTLEQILPLSSLRLAHNYHSNTISTTKCNPRSSKTLTGRKDALRRQLQKNFRAGIRSYLIFLTSQRGYRFRLL